MGFNLLEEQANHYERQVLKLASNSASLEEVIAAQNLANKAAKKARNLFDQYSKST
jgi:hypothetical protein